MHYMHIMYYDEGNERGEPMRDIMDLLDRLRRRGYEPQPDTEVSEDWLDRRFGDRILRVVIDDDEVRLLAFGAHMVLDWDVKLSLYAPLHVILAALDAAEHDAGEEDGYRASVQSHSHHHAGQTLRHSHRGGDLPHGYYSHPEDGPMHEHDGYTSHSHEVRTDHLGVSQQQEA